MIEAVNIKPATLSIYLSIANLKFSSKRIRIFFNRR